MSGWGGPSLASQVSAVVLLHCLLYVFIAKLISELCIDIKAVVNITKGTCLCLRAKWKVISTTMADSFQRMAQSLPSWRDILSNSRG